MILEVWDRRKPLNDSYQNPREGTIRAPIGSVPFSATPLLQYFASKRRLWITKTSEIGWISEVFCILMFCLVTPEGLEPSTH